MPWCCLCGSVQRTPPWATPEQSPLPDTPSDARSTARWFTGTAEEERIPRRSRPHSAPNEGGLTGGQLGHAAALCCYALRLTSDPVRSEDFVQETLLRVGAP